MLVPVKNASALDVVTLVNRVLAENAGQPGAPAEAQQRVALVADPRSNSILVRSDNPARGARVRQLIEQLDTPARAGGNVFIVYLKNAEAAQVAETLRGLYGGGERSASPCAPVPRTGRHAGRAAERRDDDDHELRRIAAATSPLVAAAATGAPTAFAAGGATIQADIANNALIIMAPEPVYNNLRAVIERLDMRRAQVFVEALIVEVTSDKAAEFGIQWQVLTGANKQQRAGHRRHEFRRARQRPEHHRRLGQPRLARPGPEPRHHQRHRSASRASASSATSGCSCARSRTTSTANILSTPTLLTLDNEEARIIVGQNVPFITGQYATTGTTATVQPFQTIERRDVGLVLRVKPQITEGGTVRLGIYQEVSRVAGHVRAPGRSCRSARSNRRSSSTTSRSSCSAA